MPFLFMKVMGPPESPKKKKRKQNNSLDKRVGCTMYMCYYKFGHFKQFIVHSKSAQYTVKRESVH